MYLCCIRSNSENQGSISFCHTSLLCLSVHHPFSEISKAVLHHLTEFKQLLYTLSNLFNELGLLYNFQALAKALTEDQLFYLRLQFKLLVPNKDGHVSFDNFRMVSLVELICQASWIWLLSCSCLFYAYPSAGTVTKWDRSNEGE